MFLLHESLWWVLISGAIGYFCGWGKGRAGVGLLLGLLLGPFGCLAIMLLPSVPRRRAAGNGGPVPEFGGGPTCPRCQRPVPRSARACPHCGNVLMRIRYAVE
jgi:hypothetical protein